jgi:hypothetical protein
MDHTVFGFTKEGLLLPGFATRGSRYSFLILFFVAVSASTYVSCCGINNSHILAGLETCEHGLSRLFEDAVSTAM